MGNEQSIIWLRVIAFDRVQTQYLGTTRCDWFEFNWCKSGCNFVQPLSLALLHAFVPSVTLMHTCCMSNNSFSSYKSLSHQVNVYYPRKPKTMHCNLWASVRKQAQHHNPVLLGWKKQHGNLMPFLSFLSDLFCWLNCRYLDFLPLTTSHILLLSTTRSLWLQQCTFPPHCLSDIDDQQCCSEKVCWFSETCDLLPITGFFAISADALFMLTKGELLDGKNA